MAVESCAGSMLTGERKDLAGDRLDEELYPAVETEDRVDSF